MILTKGFTVKERIILHLLRFAPYSDRDEVPNEVTQQGIATGIAALRPHVSIALKDLRTKEHLTESTCRIIHGKRKQKVYFLTADGLQAGNSLKRRIMGMKINVNDGTGEHVLIITQACSKYQLSLLELINQLTSDGILDLTQRPEKKAEPVDASKSTADSKPAAVGEKYEPDSGPGLPQGTHFQNQYDYLDYLSKHNPEQFEKYYAELFGAPPSSPPEPPKLSEKANVTLFFIGYFLMILGAITGAYLITTGEFLSFIPMILLLTISITIMSTSATELWSIELWQYRILNLLLVTIPIILYISFFLAVDTSTSYYDLALWLIIVFSFFGLATFGAFIPLSNRASALAALGIIIILNATVFILLNTLTIYQAGFWLLCGVLCIYVGYDLVLKLEQVETLFFGIALGLGLGILIACSYFSSQYDFTNPPASRYNILIVLTLWALIAIILIIQAVRSKEGTPKVIRTLEGLYAALPIFLGIILIFFGIFLAAFEKHIETIIELFLGGMVILYGINRLKGFKNLELILIALICFSLTLTLALILIT